MRRTTHNPFTSASSGREAFPQFESIFEHSPSIDTLARFRPVEFIQHMSPSPFMQRSPAAGAMTLDSPKSDSFTSPSWKRMLAGLRS